MINSMTGYGQAHGEIAGLTCSVEIRAVNNRYLKTNIRLPDSLAYLEEDIDKLLKQNLSRGTVTCVLRVKNGTAGVLFDIDEAAVRAYMTKLGQIGEGLGVECRLDLAGLLSLPGVVQPVAPDEQTAAQIKETVLEITRQALEQVKHMRAAEGKALAADLEGHCLAIKQDLRQIGERGKTVLQDYKRKLKKRVDQLLSEAKLTLDQETLAREVAVFADRSDISEEIARLESHLQQFTRYCGSAEADGEDVPAEAAGRRLDFITQEMLREANTIASKASDAEIIRRVVNIKCKIDSIKEQVQNVE